MDKRKITLSVIVVAILLVVLVGSTYAYWALNGPEQTSRQATVQTGGLILRLDDTEGSITTNDVIDPNHLSFNKYFSITNNGTENAYANLLFKGLTNTFVTDALVYDLEEVQQNKTSYAEPKMIIINQVIPKVSNSNATLADGLLIEKGTISGNTVRPNTKYYKLTVKYKYSDTVDQSEDLNKTLISGFTIEHGVLAANTVLLNTSAIGESTFDVMVPGYYKLEAWGAQGGSYNDSYHGGFGGYSIVYANLNSGTSLFVNVGSAGEGLSNSYSAGGYNGGGDGNASSADGNNRRSGSGGGATHIATVTKSNETTKTGELKYLEDYKGTLVNNTYYESDTILIVASGGGGVVYANYNGYYDYCSGGSGGGIIGGIGECITNRPNIRNPIGGTQTSPGKYGYHYVAITAMEEEKASFGTAGKYETISNMLAGGGGGFFGGGSSDFNYGAGGSGYIASSSIIQNTNNNIYNKMYCYDCEESSELKTYTVSTHGTTTHENERDLTNCPNGYSENAISKCAKSGNGHARITYCGPNYNNC